VWPARTSKCLLIACLAAAAAACGYTEQDEHLFGSWEGRPATELVLKAGPPIRRRAAAQWLVTDPCRASAHAVESFEYDLPRGSSAMFRRITRLRPSQIMVYCIDNNGTILGKTLVTF